MPRPHFVHFLGHTKKFLATGCLGLFMTGCAGGPNMAEFFNKTPADSVAKTNAREASERPAKGESPLNALLTRRKAADGEENPFALLDRKKNRSESNDPFLNSLGEQDAFANTPARKTAATPTETQQETGTASLKQPHKPKVTTAGQNAFVRDFDTQLQQIAGDLAKSPKRSVAPPMPSSEVVAKEESKAPPFPEELFGPAPKKSAVPPFDPVVASTTQRQTVLPPKRPSVSKPGRSRIRYTPTTPPVVESTAVPQQTDVPVWAREPSPAVAKTPSTPNPVLSIESRNTPQPPSFHQLTKQTETPSGVLVPEETGVKNVPNWPVSRVSNTNHPLGHGARNTVRQTPKRPELPTESPFPPVLMPSPKQPIHVVNQPVPLQNSTFNAGVASEVNESMIVDSDDLPSRFEQPGHFADIQIQATELEPVQQPTPLAPEKPSEWQTPNRKENVPSNPQYSPYKRTYGDLHTTGFNNTLLRRVMYETGTDGKSPLWSTANSPRVIGEEPPASLRENTSKPNEDRESTDSVESIEFVEENVAFGQAPPPPKFVEKAEPKPKGVSRATVTPESQSEKALATVDFDKLSDADEKSSGWKSRLPVFLTLFFSLGSAILIGFYLRQKAIVRSTSSNA